MYCCNNGFNEESKMLAEATWGWRRTKMNYEGVSRMTLHEASKSSGDVGESEEKYFLRMNSFH